MSNTTNPNRLRDDALTIWKAGVEAVKPSRLLAAKVSVRGSRLCIGDTEVELGSARNLIVVGAGKASANMAIEFERQVVSQLRQTLPELTVTGWINCPEGSFPTDYRSQEIELFAARPAGRNEPTENAVRGTVRIVELVAGCSQDDVVICLLSGGGSALLTAPSPGITLADKQAVARLVAAAGANIDQLNTVRRALSEVKGGGLARACRAGKMLTLIISDVLGDSLETIASGPTLVEASVSSQAALDALDELGLMDEPGLAHVISTLREMQKVAREPATCEVQHIILGNNADAVDAAGVKAVELGYRYVMQCARAAESDVLEIADHAVDAMHQILRDQQVDCWISGGEPTVQLPKSRQPGKGGRNQQLVLAALAKLTASGWPTSVPNDSSLVGDNANLAELAFISGGTDGEDGPTDAAGALFDRELFERASALGLGMQAHLSAANAYPFFEQTDGLVMTGSTGTNVCDLRVALTTPR